jgi:hypothetical protein
MSRLRLLIAASLAAATLITSAVPASAQGYTGWIENPYPSAGLWWCDWYEDGGPYDGWTYWCWAPSRDNPEEGIWFRANPDWYNANSAEMMDVFGQPVL